MIRQTNYLPFLLAAMFIHSCSTPSETSSVKKEYTGWTNPTWIESRVSESKERILASPAGDKLWSSIEAHGGLKKWFENGPIRFQFDYQPLDGGKRRNSYQTVDKWSVRAVHQLPHRPEWTYGWDGNQAWIYPDTAQVDVNVRFWSITPYYFIGLPFVLADDGIVLEDLGTKVYQEVTYDLVKASYEPGTGDAPDDYYVIYINQETGLMGGLRYIVSYPGFFPDGGHNPEKFMEITGMQNVEGISLPIGYETYWYKEDSVAEHITTIDVSNISFHNDLEKDFFDMPKDAKVQEGF